MGDQSPTKPEKIRLLEQTGLNETQINGWFKREWLKQKQLAIVPSPLFPPIAHYFISANTDKFDIGVSRLDQNMKRIVEKSIRTR